MGKWEWRLFSANVYLWNIERIIHGDFRDCRNFIRFKEITCQLPFDFLRENFLKTIDLKSVESLDIFYKCVYTDCVYIELCTMDDEIEKSRANKRRLGEEIWKRGRIE